MFFSSSSLFSLWGCWKRRRLAAQSASQSSSQASRQQAAPATQKVMLQKTNFTLMEKLFNILQACYQLESKLLPAKALQRKRLPKLSNIFSTMGWAHLFLFVSPLIEDNPHFNWPRSNFNQRWRRQCPSASSSRHCCSKLLHISLSSNQLLLLLQLEV